MSITKCLKQAKFHMGYNELIKKYPDKEQEIRAIAWTIAKVFSTTRQRMRFNGMLCPIAKLKEKLGYLNQERIELILKYLPSKGNIQTNIESFLLPIKKQG